MPDTLPQSSEEDSALQAELDLINKFPKLREWVRLFLDKSNRTTYGNRTQSALVAYDCNNVSVAAAIGSQNFRKLKHMAMLYYEQEGMTVSKVLDLIAAHAVNGKPKALEMLASLTQVWEAKPGVLIQANIGAPVQTTPQDEAQMKADFQEFIDAKYGTPSDTQPPIESIEG